MASLEYKVQVPMFIRGPGSPPMNINNHCVGTRNHCVSQFISKIVLEYNFWALPPQEKMKILLIYLDGRKTLFKNVKIDPHEYVLQGSPLPLLSTKILRI